MVLRYVIAAAALLLSGVAQAQARVPTVEGRWAMRTGGRAILIVEIDCERREHNCRGVLTRPEHGTLSNLGSFEDVYGAPVTRPFRVEITGPARGTLLLAPKQPGGQIDRVLFERLGENHATLRPDHPSVPPLPMELAKAGETVTPTWDRWRVHPVDQRWPSSVEAKQLFDNDQAGRLSGAPIDWSKMSVADAGRRSRMRALLDLGQLRSGDDFYHAAFVFQHGSTPGDFLLAHTLAIAAAARGRSDAAWIAAATLDRYLHNIGRPQIYGTQYSDPGGNGWTQEPYDKLMISDGLRSALGVPPIASQQQRQAEMQAERSKR